MKQKEGYWVDERNNKWSMIFDTEESAEVKSKSLENCSDCRNCSDCSSCSDCSYFKQNPQRYTTPCIGSRSKQTTFYWTNKNDVTVVCGCFNGKLSDFVLKVKETHQGNEFEKQYLKEVEKVKLLIK